MATVAGAQALRPYDADIYAPDLIAVWLLFFELFAFFRG